MAWHVKEVLEKNICYKIVSAKIKKTKYSFVTLISVKPVFGEGGTLKTYFLSLHTKELIDSYNYEYINIKQCPELLCDLVFAYTGEVESPTGNFYSNLWVGDCVGGFLVYKACRF